ncbi:MAG: glutamate-5-semialdehyde dehydrogenase [Bdellovibrionia bacterium]
MSARALVSQLKQVRSAGGVLRLSRASQRNRVLRRAADLLQQRQAEILTANQRDLKALDLSSHAKHRASFRDRLTLTPGRLAQMRQSLRRVAQARDPVGQIVDSQKLKNGLLLQKVRSPLGVIFMIFESRPNVAVEAFSLGFKAGNAMILKGGRESQFTVSALMDLLHEALAAEGVPKEVLWGLPSLSRAEVRCLLEQKQWIDVVVPRGGEALIQFVERHSRIPMIKNDRGLCHIYVDEKADLQMACEVVVNAKTQRPGVCNAMETLLVHQSIASLFLPQLFAELKAHSVELVLCARSYALAAQGGWGDFAQKATRRSWDQEYLDLKMNCRVVSSLQEAMEHIDRHGSRHSEAILTQNHQVAEQFQREVDSAAVYWNASTRFTDGFEFGLGGELGISTQKLHVRGPVGLEALTTPKWVICGQGQIRAS